MLNVERVNDLRSWNQSLCRSPTYRLMRSFDKVLGRSVASPSRCRYENDVDNVIVHNHRTNASNTVSTLRILPTAAQQPLNSFQDLSMFRMFSYGQRSMLSYERHCNYILGELKLLVFTRLRLNGDTPRFPQGQFKMCMP